MEISKCFNPDHDLDSAVPVIEPHGLLNDKHCAYCNVVDKNAPLTRWKRIQIQSDRYVSFPKSDLLQELQQARGTIFFMPPGYLKVDLEGREPIPENMIDICNVSGFAASVKTACESFIDP